MTWLVLSWFLACGLVPAQNETVITMGRRNADITEAWAVSTEIGLKAEAFGFLRAWTSIETYELYATGLSFAPYRANYKIGASAFWGPIELRITHECDHPVITDEPRAAQYFGGETEIALLISGTTIF